MFEYSIEPMSPWPTNNLEQISVASTSDPGVRNHGTKTSCLYIRPESPQSTSNLEQIPVASTSDPGVRNRQATCKKNQLPLHRTRESAIRKQLGTKTNCLYIGLGSPRSTSNWEQKPIASTSDSGVRDRQATRNKNQLPLQSTPDPMSSPQCKTNCPYIGFGSQQSVVASRQLRINLEPSYPTELRIELPGRTHTLAKG